MTVQICISIHAPCERERRTRISLTWCRLYFNPRSLREGATVNGNGVLSGSLFQSTLPARGSDYITARSWWLRSPFQSTLPARGSDPAIRQKQPPQGVFQSTLPARGSDGRVLWRRCARGWHFNPRSLREGATFRVGSRAHRRPLFQSTLPARGSDGCRPRMGGGTSHFNPRSLREGATFVHSLWVRMVGISIHAPCERERPSPVDAYCSIDIFQSTLPARGSDYDRRRHNFFCINFNPRSLREGATFRCTVYRYFINHFNPRSLREGATIAAPLEMAAHLISIHAPCERERHRLCLTQRCLYRHFNPRSLREGATLPKYVFAVLYGYFNPRSLREGATAEKCICMQHFCEFAEYYPLRRDDAHRITPRDGIIQAFFGAKEQRFYVRLCFALKNKGIRG